MIGIRAGVMDVIPGGSGRPARTAAAAIAMPAKRAVVPATTRVSAAGVRRVRRAS